MEYHGYIKSKKYQGEMLHIKHRETTQLDIKPSTSCELDFDKCQYYY